MDAATSWLELDLLNNPLRLWVSAAGMFAVSLLLVGLVRTLLRRRLRKAADTTTDVDDVLLSLVERTNLFLLALPLANLSLSALSLPPKALATVRFLAVVGFMIQVGLWASALAEFWLRRHKRERGADPVALTTLSALSFVLKIVVWVIVGVLTLDNLGFDVTALVTGLGIGGIAIALATQNILGDLFASLSIIVDKPFVIGDFIIVGEQMGKVEKIGMKTTRVRSLSGE
ncbi:MAG TPA: mechanosensitive ion channel domain-containing protein, partial [Thermoanaerobaculia bacterium]|nr:mechanosensitive ion channel domain-containing protein [Thermoanaerobaculia bacterium]